MLCVIAVCLVLCVFSITALAAAPAAKIGNTSYTTLGAAITAVQNGQTIVLQRDIANEGTEGVWIDREGISFAIDLNGKTISESREDCSGIYISAGTVAIKNGTIRSTGQYSSYDACALVVDAGATATLDKMTMSSVNDYCCFVYSSALNVLSGTYTGYEDAIYVGGYDADSQGNVNITSGTFITDADSDSGDGSLYSNDNGVIYINSSAVVIPDDWETDPALVITVILFKDIPSGAWYKGHVYDLVSKGIINGKATDVFDPEGKVTRAEFAKILATASMENIDNYIGDSGFNDVATTAWYCRYINWASQNEIVNGTGNGLFSPNAPITRQEIAVMLYRCIAMLEDEGRTLPTEGAPIIFSDASLIQSWAETAVDTMVRAGIINGYEDSTFRPNNTATRAEAAKMVDVFLDSIVPLP